MISSDRGAVAVEGILAIGVFTLALVFQMELARRGAVEMMVWHRAFWEVRASVLGETVAESWGRQWQAVALSNQVQVHRESLSGACRAKAYLRFPMLHPFRLRSGNRHHFEVTRQCSFPRSLP